MKLKLKPLKTLLKRSSLLFSILISLLSSCLSTSKINKDKKVLTSQAYPALNYDLCKFSYKGLKFGVGDNVESWTSALGMYDRKKNLVVRNYPFIENDSIYVWDSLGITLKTSINNEWKVEEAFFFINNISNKEKESDTLFFEHIKNTYYYPKSIFKKNILVDDVEINSKDTSIVTINKKLKNSGKELFAYELDFLKIKKMTEKEQMIYLSDDMSKTEPNYGKTDINIDGLYTCKNTGSGEITIIVTNNKLEFIRFVSPKCNN